MQGRFQPVTPSTPDFMPSLVSPSWSPATSDISATSSQSSLTLSFEQLALGRGRGQPRKTLQPPSNDDYPVNALKEEQEQWVCQKATEQWCYNKSMSESANAYRKLENECDSYIIMKKKKEAAATKGVPDDDAFFQEEAEKQHQEDVKKE